jgi:WD40 repeat protein
VAINHDGSIYAIGGLDAVTAYDLQSGEQLNEFTVEQYKECEFACPIHALAFSPDNNLLVFASAVSEVESAIVDLNTGEKTTPADVGTWELIFSPDNRLIASATGAPGYIPDRLLLTDANTGEAVAVVELYVSSIAFSRSGELLAVGVYDDDAPNPDEATGLIYFFEIDQLVANRDLQPVMTLSTVRPPSAIAFSTDDKVIAIGDAGKLLLWGVASND